MKPDVAVIGAGAIGLSIAWRLAQRGLRVTVVDARPGSGASTVAAGMLAPVTEAHFGEEPLLTLGLASLAKWPDFAAELVEASGQDIGYRTDGTLVVAMDADAVAEIERLHRFYTSLGLPADPLTGTDCRQAEPLLSPRVRGGMFAAGDHQADSRRVVTALLAAVERAGVEIDRRRLANLDEVTAGTVVVAAGSWSARFVRLPVRPVKGQLLRLRASGVGPGFRYNVRAMADGGDVYLVPRESGEVVVGATVEERGYDTTVTAGAVHELLHASAAVLPEIAEYELAEAIAGLRPGTPDNAPMLGQTGKPGVIVATGHYRQGILLTPITAEAVADLVTTDRVPELIAPFGPDRFDGGTAP